MVSKRLYKSTVHCSENVHSKLYECCDEKRGGGGPNFFPRTDNILVYYICCAEAEFPKPNESNVFRIGSVIYK
jgi:hypothetical protein